MAGTDYGAFAPTEPETYSLGAGAFINVLGGLISIALMGGVVVWGYQLLARDVSGVPVVAALEGPMRVAPEEPGGRPAAHQGLAVNEVAATGIAGSPRDRLVLAPSGADLTDEDAATSVVAALPAPVVAEGIDDTILAAPTDPDMADLADVAAIVDAIAATAAPLGEVRPPSSSEESSASLQTTVPAPNASPLSTQPLVDDNLGPGLRASLRPRARPARTAPLAPQPPVTRASLDLNAADIPAGTRLVQLGAFDSDAIARTEWDRLFAQFGDYMQGKKRVIQKAQKAGKTFYRLRAHGFVDVADARRFCSQLVAQNADCIPVLVK